MLYFVVENISYCFKNKW